MNHILFVATATTAVGFLGLVLTGVAIVSRASRREDKAGSLSGPARGRIAAAVRQWLAVDADGFLFTLSPYEGWRAIRPVPVLLIPFLGRSQGGGAAARPAGSSWRTTATFTPCRDGSAALPRPALDRPPSPDGDDHKLG